MPVSLVHGAGDGVLGTKQTAGAGQGDVDGLGGEGGIAGPGACGRFQERVHERFERVEALA